jgi:hypothetical protein
MRSFRNEQSLQSWYALFLSSLGVLFCASAGGMRTNLSTAKKMKAAGYRKGFPDMMILEPRGAYSGMFVELKCGKKSKASTEQKGWRTALNVRNYHAVIMPSLEYREAQEWLERETRAYLGIGLGVSSKFPV